MKKIIAGILDGCRILGFSQWLRRALCRKPRIMILCYHRVVTQGGLISPQCISSSLFEQQIKFFVAHTDVISLDDVERYFSGELKLNRDAVAITFDDGYADNYHNAAPILARYSVKATFFVASTPILEGKNYWFDELSSSLEALHGTGATVSLPTLPELAQQIATFIAIPTSERKGSAKAIFLAMNLLDESQKSMMLGVLREASQAVSQAPLNIPDLMSEDQLAQLCDAGHAIGAHTCTHPRLSNLKTQAVEDEISTGVLQLRARFGEIRNFAYPFGKLADIPADKTELFAVLQRCGFHLAVTTEDNVVTSDDQHFLVPRKVMSAQSVAQVRLKMELMAWQS